MKIVLALLAVAMAGVPLQAQLTYERKIDWNLPKAVARCLDQEFWKRYDLSDRVNPFYLRGDFDGDGKIDYAVLVRDKSNNKLGIAICQGRSTRPTVLGAGKAFGNAGDSFDWMDAWEVYAKGPVEQGAGESPPPRLLGEAILVEKTESASALIYWDGKNYRWYQRGD